MDKVKAISIFVEIAEQGSLSGAARSLGVVNSVITKNLNELEEWLDKKLIYRSTRSMRLTDDGLQCLDHCREILQKLNGLTAETSLESLQGTVRITAPRFLSNKLLVPLLVPFRRLHPNVCIELVADDQSRDIVKEGFDLAFRASQMPDSGLIARRLWQFDLKLVASPEYLQEQGTPKSITELQQHKAIIEGDNSKKMRWRFKGARGRQRTCTPKGNTLVNFGEAVKAYCLGGAGIAQLPSFFVDDEIKQRSLVELMPEFALNNFYIHLLYHKKSTKNPTTKALIEHIYTASPLGGVSHEK